MCWRAEPRGDQPLGARHSSLRWLLILALAVIAGYVNLWPHQ